MLAARKFHTCSLRSIFSAAHVAGENDFTFFRRAGGETLRGFGTAQKNRSAFRRAVFLFLRELLALNGVGEAAEPIALHVLDAAGIARRRDGGVDGQLGRVGDAVLGGNGLDVALAEDGMLLAAVRAGVVGHVLNDAEHGHVHHVGHVDSLVDDHADKLLRRRDDDHARHGQGLEHRQRHVARSGRHIDEHIVHILPLDVGPEQVILGEPRSA